MRRSRLLAIAVLTTGLALPFVAAMTVATAARTPNTSRTPAPTCRPDSAEGGFPLLSLDLPLCVDLGAIYAGPEATQLIGINLPALVEPTTLSLTPCPGQPGYFSSEQTACPAPPPSYSPAALVTCPAISPGPALVLDPATPCPEAPTPTPTPTPTPPPSPTPTPSPSLSPSDEPSQKESDPPKEQEQPPAEQPGDESDDSGGDQSGGDSDGGSDGGSDGQGDSAGDGQSDGQADSSADSQSSGQTEGRADSRAESRADAQPGAEADGQAAPAVQKDRQEPRGRSGSYDGSGVAGEESVLDRFAERREGMDRKKAVVVIFTGVVTVTAVSALSRTGASRRRR